HALAGVRLRSNGDDGAFLSAERVPMRQRPLRRPQQGVQRRRRLWRRQRRATTMFSLLVHKVLTRGLDPAELNAIARPDSWKSSYARDLEPPLATPQVSSTKLCVTVACLVARHDRVAAKKRRKRGREKEITARWSGETNSKLRSSEKNRPSARSD
ncbi:unnamed protein product, partial [Heterotrigona itama]